jgi:AcrR family transcriptional regulator
MPKPRRTVRRRPLSRERILEVAMALADEEGVDAITMRAVATRLGVEAMSLYRHVKNKGDILDGLVELVASEMEVPTMERGWRDGLRARATSARAVLLRHRWAPVLIEQTITPGPRRLALFEATLDVLRRSGFSVELAYLAQLAVDSYLYGFVLQEVSWPFEPGQEPELIEQMRGAIPRDVFPRLGEVMDLVANRASAIARRGAGAHSPYDEDFAAGLELVLDSLARKL